MLIGENEERVYNENIVTADEVNQVQRKMHEW